ncbi:MAG: outer membrane protein assembly factor BamA [Pleomorphochaeta sp.]
MFKKFSLLILISFISVFSLFAADDAWYDGVKISQFETDGIINANDNEVSNILFKYRNKIYSEDLFNQLQAELYSLNYFSYFYADAVRVKPDTNELKLVITFFEKQLLNDVTFNGNDEIDDSTLLEKSALSLDTFYEGFEMANAAEQIKMAYNDKGFSNVNVSPELIEDTENNTVSINFEITEGKQVIVSEIEFEGNENYNSKILANQIKSTTKSLFKSGYYSETKVQADLENLLNFYYNHGYITATVTGPEKVVLSETETKETIKLIYNVNEGNVWTLGELRLEGNELITTEELLTNITLEEGDVFNRGLWMQELSNISQIYYDAGYIKLAINPLTSVDEEKNLINFIIQINEGPRAKINKIIINGIGNTQEKVYLRELEIKEGDYFNKSAVEQSLRNIQNTQLVTELNYSIDAIDEENCNLIIELTEGGQQDIQFGATFGGTTDDFPISGFATLTDRNVFGTGNDLSTSVTLSPSTQKASVSFTDEYFGEIPWSNGFSLSFQHSYVDDVLVKGSDSFYTGHLEEEDSENAYPLGYSSYDEYLAADEDYPDSQYLMDYELYRISAGYNTGYTFDFDPGSLILSTGLDLGVNRAYFDSNYLPFSWLIYQYSLKWQFSNKYTLGIAWDGRDLINNTTRGWYVAQNFTYAGGILGGLSNYNKSVTSFAAYTPIYSWVNEEEKQKTIVGSYSSSFSLMLPQYYNHSTYGYGFYDAIEGATVSEMLYIDGTSVALGHDVVEDLEFVFDNKLSLQYSIVDNILAVDTFISATAVSEDYSDAINFNNWDWYFATGIGAKLEISGFPIGLYLVKDATILNSESEDFTFVEGSLFNFTDDNSIFNGVNLVLAFTTSLY